jgi:ferritin-like metal-binding protein YciE
MEILTLSALFERWLDFAYDGEQRVIKELPSMTDAVSSSELGRVLQQYLNDVQKHLARLESSFSARQRTPAPETNHAIQGLLKESENLIHHIDPSALLDTGLVMTLNQVTHSQMALYGSLVSLARLLQLEPDASVLEENLTEKKAMDHKLTVLAVERLNPAAVEVHNTPHHMPII